MLVYFKVGNYKSIKEPVVINFASSAISELQGSNVFRKEKDDLLRSILLYGANASGKSKILDALVFFRHLILNSATDKQSNEEIETEPFLLNPISREQPGFFEAEFYIGKTKYRYGFEADKKKIHKEWLLEVRSTTTAHFFLRNEQEFQINSKKFIEGEGLEKRTRPRALFLSVAAQWNGILAQSIINWFAGIYVVNGMMDSHHKKTTTDMLKLESCRQMISDLIKRADVGIQNIEALDIPEKIKEQILSAVPVNVVDFLKDQMEGELKPIGASHNILDQQGKIVGETTFSLENNESEGTKKLYNLAGVFVDAVRSGKLVVIDEFDARLHTLLTRAIIQMFNSAGTKSEAQLLAVSHDTALLDKDLLRRDQIYFVEKDNYAASKVATLVEFKARKETPYYKNYLEGKYGAIPFIENLENVITNVEEKQ